MGAFTLIVVARHGNGRAARSDIWDDDVCFASPCLRNRRGSRADRHRQPPDHQSLAAPPAPTRDAESSSNVGVGTRRHGATARPRLARSSGHSRPCEATPFG